MSTKKSPSYVILVVFGLFCGGVLSYFYPRPPSSDQPILNIILPELLFGTVFAYLYYFLLRGAVANAKLEDGARIGFAKAFFVVIGMMLGKAIIETFHGNSLVNEFLYFVTNSVPLAIAYHKLLKLYRGAGPGTGGPG